MKCQPLRLFTLLASLCLSSIQVQVRAADTIPCQLGPVGGTFLAVPGPGQLRVLTVTPGGPGAAAGLQAGDIIYGAFDEDFSPFLGGDLFVEGFKGCVQDYGEAIERAESGNVPLALKVIRPGVGGLTLSVHLPAVGGFGAAYPLGSPKFDAMYEYAVARVHSIVMASANSYAGDAGYTDGWFGFCLLSHPNWNETTGLNPYRNSINRIRDWIVARLPNSVYEPLESTQPGYVDSDLGNWQLSLDAMFLAQYRMKTGDASVDPSVQLAAEMLANRVQYWPGAEGGHIGRAAHGGVTGDYGEVGINIVAVQLQLAMAMLKSAGANFSGQSGTAAGPAPEPYTFMERAQIGLNWLKSSTQITPGLDTGNVGYQEIQEEFGYDSSGRTAAAVAAFHLWELPFSADDLEKLGLMKSYLPRQWQKFQNSHVASICGVNFYQMALPFLPDRDQRFIMENIRYFFHLHRKADSTLDYFPGRMEFDSDLALGAENVALINVAMARVIAGGTLPSFPSTNITRLNAFMKSPWVSWPTQEAHVGKVKGSAPVTLDVSVTDYAGVPVTSGLTANWSMVSGPGMVTFGDSNLLATTATFSSDGLYRLQLVASKGGYTLTEPYDLTVTLNPVEPPAPTPPVVSINPPNLSHQLGDTATMTISVTGSGPFVYQWKLNGTYSFPASGSPDLVLNNIGGFVAGSYQCVITGPGGVATSAKGTLTITNSGILTQGGLWRDKFNGLSSIESLTDSPRFPGFADSGKGIDGGDAPNAPGDAGGYFSTRWSGWLFVGVTGEYRLLATTGGEGGAIQVALSTNQLPSSKTNVVSASVNDGGYRVWSTAPASAYTTLVSGQRYFIEVLTSTFAEGPGEAILLQKQGDPLPADGTPDIPGSQLEYLTGGVFEEPVNQVDTNPTNIVLSLNGNNLTLSWPLSHTGWSLLEQTNNFANGVSQSPTDWSVVPGSVTTNQVIIPIDQAKPARFYRLRFP